MIEKIFKFNKGNRDQQCKVYEKVRNKKVYKQIKDGAQWS